MSACGRFAPVTTSFFQQSGWLLLPQHQPNDLNNVLHRPVETATQSGILSIRFGVTIAVRTFYGFSRRK
jgi:hypothetical protein